MKKVLKGIADLRKPHEWWIRGSKRRIVHHLGPTNSGKTYEALERLKLAKSGIYLAPLRLLASEIYEKLNSSGVPCSLITGQEQILVPGSKHTACTIETADLSCKYDVSVIDEIQMIGDIDRGSAWTNALLGLSSRELHLTGDLRSKSIVQSLTEDTEEDVEFKKYTRFSPLELDPIITSLKDIKEGDCIIAFSRKKCHIVRKFLEQHKGGCSIIYGNLPPNTRKEQARKFNERSEVKYLVSTDAVGMGVNYNINRVIFLETSKHDGKKVRKLFPYEVRQIAGRAGRFKLTGKVSAFAESDLKFIEKCLSDDKNAQISKAGLFPSFEKIEEFASRCSNELKYSSILKKFSKMANLEKKYFFQSIEDICEISDKISKYHLSLYDNYIFSHSPVRGTLKEIEIFAKNICKFGNVKLPHKLFDRESTLATLEKAYFVLELYNWLGNKYGSAVFIHIDEAKMLMEMCVHLIEERLDELDVTDLGNLRNY